MDFHAEMRRTYLGAVPHTLFTSVVWLSSGMIGVFASKGAAITFFIVSGTFIFPGGELIRSLMKIKNVVSKENKLPMLFMLLAFGIPASYPLIYLTCKANINYFFPAFTILIGAHYLPFVYGYMMRTFAVFAAALVTEGILCIYFFSEHFALSAFITAALMIIFATLHYFTLKTELI